MPLYPEPKCPLSHSSLSSPSLATSATGSFPRLTAARAGRVSTLTMALHTQNTSSLPALDSFHPALLCNRLSKTEDRMDRAARSLPEALPRLLGQDHCGMYEGCPWGSPKPSLLLPFLPHGSDDSVSGDYERVFLPVQMRVSGFQTPLPPASPW